MIPRPWSNKQLRDVTNAIREGRDAEADPQFSEIAAWYDSLLSETQSRLIAYLHEHWSGPKLSFSARVKTIDTLREKLQRYPNQKLNTVRDIIGLRLEVDSHLDDQDTLVGLVRECFEALGTEVQVLDYRTDDQFGYRAVHLELRFAAPARVRAEIQVRTRLQGQWANLYELVAELVGRDIRYSDDLAGTEIWPSIVRMRGYSTEAIAHLEESWTRGRKLMARISSDSALRAKIEDAGSELAASLEEELTSIEAARASLLTELAQLENEILGIVYLFEEHTKHDDGGA